MIDNQAKTHTNKHYFKDGITNVGETKFSTGGINKLINCVGTIDEENGCVVIQYLFHFENSLEALKDKNFAIYFTNFPGRTLRRHKAKARLDITCDDFAETETKYLDLTYRDSHTLVIRFYTSLDIDTFRNNETIIGIKTPIPCESVSSFTDYFGPHYAFDCSICTFETINTEPLVNKVVDIIAPLKFTSIKLSNKGQIIGGHFGSYTPFKTVL